MIGLCHGGDVAAFGAANPSAPRPFIDLSTGINPLPYSAGVDQHALARLPGKEDYDLCIDAFARYALVDREFVHVMPGSQSAISILPTLVEPCDVAILKPTYNEHETNWTRFGHRVGTFTAEHLMSVEADIIVLTNPNNPDGHVFDRETLSVLQERQAARAGWLIVDEAFVDASPTMSVADGVGRGGLIVLRSFGKFFGLAGLRLGFTLAPEIVGARLAERLGPWSINTLALTIGAQAYANSAWIEATRKRLALESARLNALLKTAGLKVIGETALFQLVAYQGAQDLAAHLASRGIFVRTFENAPHRLRFGLPGSTREWARLGGALEEFGETT